jgi:hypothetical protein
MIVTKRRVRDAVDAAVPSREAGAGPAARPVSDDLARERTALLSVFANARPDVHMPAEASWRKADRVRQNRVVLAPVAGVKLAEVTSAQPGSTSHIRRRR